MCADLSRMSVHTGHLCSMDSGSAAIWSTSILFYSLLLMSFLSLRDTLGFCLATGPSVNFSLRSFKALLHVLPSDPCNRTILFDCLVFQELIVGFAHPYQDLFSLLLHDIIDIV